MNEIPFKRWKTEQAIKLRMSLAAFQSRLHKGLFKYPDVRRVNERVIFIRADASAESVNPVSHRSRRKQLLKLQRQYEVATGGKV